MCARYAPVMRLPDVVTHTMGLESHPNCDRMFSGAYVYNYMVCTFAYKYSSFKYIYTIHFFFVYVCVCL